MSNQPHKEGALAKAADVPLPALPPYWPTNGWRRAPPEEQGVDPAALARAVQHARDQLPSLYSLLVIRNGHLVFEEHVHGHAPGDSYSVRSVTKSVTSSLIGIALHHGDLAGLDQPIGALLPAYLPPGADPQKRRITIRDLLTMTAGFQWDEPGEEAALYRSDDWVRFMIERPLAAAPGTTFTYNTGLSQLLSAILTQVTGRRAFECARRWLFGPLGIQSARWEDDAQGRSIGGFGLSLRADDLAKLGFLYLHGGQWDGQQLLAPAYVRASTTAWSSGGFPEETGYGFHWWVTEEHGSRAYFAAGYGGQYLFVVPTLDLIVVTTARYDLPPAQTLARDLITRGVLPAVILGGSL